MGMLQGTLDDYVRQERLAQGQREQDAARPVDAAAAVPLSGGGATAAAIENLQQSLVALEALQQGAHGAGAAGSASKTWWGWVTAWVPQSWRAGGGAAAAEGSAGASTSGGKR